jgi:hypothetical protein
LLGDPELNLWTNTPAPMVATYDTVITAPGDFTVAVERSGAPLPGALVCVRDHDAIYQYGHTDSLGRITFALYPRKLGTLEVTITARNCIPHEGTSRIAAVGICGNAPPARGSPVLEVAPNPARSQVTIRTFEPARVAIYDGAGRLALSKTGVRDWAATGLPSGVYVVRACFPDGREERRLVRLLQ